MSIGSARRRIHRLLPGSDAATWAELATVAAAFPNGGALLRRLTVAADIESLWDSLAELRYALIFKSIGCEVSWEPDGSAGPDLAVRTGNTTLAVEVARFRPMNAGPPPLGEFLQVYGNPARDVAKSITKLTGKFRQIGERRGIIALWNDDEALEDLEVRVAATYLRRSAQLPAELVGVVYGSKCIGPQQLFWFSLAREADLVVEGIGERLGHVRVAGPVEPAWRRALSNNGMHLTNGLRQAGRPFAGDPGVLPAPPRSRSAAPEERADLLVAPPVLPRSGAAEQADAPDAARREARGLPPGRAADPRVRRRPRLPR